MEVWGGNGGVGGGEAELQMPWGGVGWPGGGAHPGLSPSRWPGR